ncbi:hypothetical protein PSENEW3_00005479 [Picochlorum sp. SENEW3]|nr:hypothetical protein PSENEW3_00005479 [Picochlorum sp. SENEW3]
MSSKASKMRMDAYEARGRAYQRHWTQHKIQLDARDRDPSLVQPPHPFMAPVQQQMGMPQPPPHMAGGYPGQQQPAYAGYPPPPK